MRSGKGSVPDEVKPAYELLDDCIRNRHFGLIFSRAAALEWVDGNATLESALEIASVIDSAALQYEIELDTFIYLHEVLNQLREEHPDLVLPHFEILFVRDRKQIEASNYYFEGYGPRVLRPRRIDGRGAPSIVNG
jgi:hypothetical protein